MDTTIPRSMREKKDVRILSVNWNQCTIGYLMKEKNGSYFYKYDQRGIQEARRNGYHYMVGFKDTRKVYVSKELFPAFKSRIPSKQRRDLADILARAGIENYDEFDLLALSGGRLLTDAISFEEYEQDKIMLDRRTRRNCFKNYGTKKIDVPENKGEDDGR